MTLIHKSEQGCPNQKQSYAACDGATVFHFALSGILRSAKKMHLACLVESKDLALIYNHQAVGKHPAVRFSSL
jgi:hypothetical protein